MTEDFQKILNRIEKDGFKKLNEILEHQSKVYNALKKVKTINGGKEIRSVVNDKRRNRENS